MNESHPDAAIRLVSSSTEARFEWRDFDGDDCFNDFQLIVATPDSSRRFEFGACANFGLRKLLKFFGDTTQTTAGLGFRHPDIRYLDIHRASEGFHITVRFEGSGLHEEIAFQSPALHIQRNTNDA